jgi:hypothetical protein
VEEVIGDAKNFSAVAPSRRIGFVVGQGVIAK